MWIILFNATDDFGVKEIKKNPGALKDVPIEEVQQQIMDEALQGALRIAGLVCICIYSLLEYIKIYFGT